MNPPLYPLQFEPLYQYRVWGGRRLAGYFAVALPGTEPVGEAWVLSDRDDHASRVASGPLKGRSIAQLLHDAPRGMLGTLSGRFARFPLLLKFLDVQERLSVQVHPAGKDAKTEAWVVLEAGLEGRVYAGLKPAVTTAALRLAVADGTVADRLASFPAVAGDGIFLRAGTVHSLQDAVVFEVQQNSDVTFRLYDWNKVDARTGSLRELQVDQALACLSFPQPTVAPAVPVLEAAEPVRRERLFRCAEFEVWRLRGAAPFRVGAAETPRVLVCLTGEGQLEHGGIPYALRSGAVLFLPAAVGACPCRLSAAATLLEISLPQHEPAIRVS